MLERWTPGIEGKEELDDPYITLTKRDYEGMKRTWQEYGFGVGFVTSSLITVGALLLIAWFLQ